MQMSGSSLPGDCCQWVFPQRPKQIWKVHCTLTLFLLTVTKAGQLAIHGNGHWGPLFLQSIGAASIILQAFNTPHVYRPGNFIKFIVSLVLFAHESHLQNLSIQNLVILRITYIDWWRNAKPPLLYIFFLFSDSPALEVLILRENVSRKHEITMDFKILL